VPTTAIGIDLGTTYSAVAIVGEDGRAHAIPNAEGALTTPSVALYDDGTFLIGQAALRRIQRAQGEEHERLSNSLIRSVKRMMGNPPARGLVSNGHHTTPIEVSAAILTRLARDASAHLGFNVRDAVITVPAHFGDKERHHTRQAAEIAGLHILKVVNEPSAAALTYTYGQQSRPGQALVFDLGGGTFDATILQLGEKEARVLGTQGIEELGGVNFTNSLAELLQQRYRSQTDTSYPDDHLSLDRLVAAAESAKCVLSEQSITQVPLVPTQGATASIEVTRAQFEELIDLFVIQLEGAVELALDRARKTPREIDRVLLCGGSSRVPVIQAMLTNLFGRPPEQVLDLDLSVALGAAYEAFNCLRQAENKEQSGGLQIVVDCVSYAVGLAVLDRDGANWTKLVMLHQGDPLTTWSPPFSVRIVGSIEHFRPITVYKGEGAHLDPDDFIGEIPLTLPPGTSQGALATIRMMQDQNGLIQVQLLLNERELPGMLRRV
jgi:molecular chaperone DnaK